MAQIDTRRRKGEIVAAIGQAKDLLRGIHGGNRDDAFISRRIHGASDRPAVAGGGHHDDAPRRGAFQGFFKKAIRRPRKAHIDHFHIAGNQPVQRLNQADRVRGFAALVVQFKHRSRIHPGPGRQPAILR